jgi:hypothetical protein
MQKVGCSLRRSVCAVIVAAGPGMFACRDATSPEDDAFEAAEGFARTADSIAAVEGASAAALYYGIAEALGRTGSFTPVTLRFDGRDEQWNGLGTETVIRYEMGNATNSPTTTVDPAAPIKIRSLLLWDPVMPRRVAQLITFADGDIGVPTDAQNTTALRLPKAVLSYSDGNGGAWRSMPPTDRGRAFVDNVARDLQEGGAGVSARRYARCSGYCTFAQQRDGNTYRYALAHEGGGSTNHN